MEALKEQLQVKRKKDLSIVVEEKDEGSVKRSTSEVRLQQGTVSIKDLKEPLQLLSLNTPLGQTGGKAGVLSRASEKKGRVTGRKRVS